MHFLTSTRWQNFPPDFEREKAICDVKAYQHITDRIIRAIETEGLLPWRFRSESVGASRRRSEADDLERTCPARGDAGQRQSSGLHLSVFLFRT